MTRITKALNHLRLFWYFLILLTLGQITWWIFDNRPPFIMTQYWATPVKPGGQVYFLALVKRDIARNCSVIFSRHMFDSEGARYDIVSGQQMSAVALRQMETVTPGELRLWLRVPEQMPLGTARMVTVLEYQCNPIHHLRGGINVDMTMEFEVIS